MWTLSVIKYRLGVIKQVNDLLPRYSHPHIHCRAVCSGWTRGDADTGCEDYSQARRPTATIVALCKTILILTRRDRSAGREMGQRQRCGSEM